MTLDSQGKEAQEPERAGESSVSDFLGDLGADEYTALALCADLAVERLCGLKSKVLDLATIRNVTHAAGVAFRRLAAQTRQTPARDLVSRIIASGASPYVGDETPASEAEAALWLAEAFLEEYCESHACWGDEYGPGALIEVIRAEQEGLRSAQGDMPAGPAAPVLEDGGGDHQTALPEAAALSDVLACERHETALPDPAVGPQLRTRIELEAKLAELEAEHTAFSHEDPIVARAMNAMFTNRIAGLEYALGRDSLPPTAALSGDPPGLRLVWEVDDRHFAPTGPGEWHVELASTQGQVRSVFFRQCATRQAGEAEVRAAAWSWHARRRALAERLRGGEGLCEEVWPGCLGWGDAEVAEVERWLAEPTARRPMVLAHSSQFALLRNIADSIGVRARHAILTAHERFEAGEEEVLWNFGELFGACRMHPEGDKSNRADVRTTGREYASNMAAAHINGAILGMLALVRHAEQEIGE